MEKKSSLTYIGIGISIGVLLTVTLIYIFGITPQSISIGLVDFSLPNSSDSPNTSLPKCRSGNNTGISGQVISASGEPVSNVSITSDPPTESVITDGNGFYLICNIPAESTGRQYKILAQKLGYYNTELIVTAMPDNTAVGNIVLEIAP